MYLSFSAYFLHRVTTPKACSYVMGCVGGGLQGVVNEILVWVEALSSMAATDSYRRKWTDKPRQQNLCSSSLLSVPQSHTSLSQSVFAYHGRRVSSLNVPVGSKSWAAVDFLAAAAAAAAAAGYTPHRMSCVGSVEQATL